MDQRELEYLRLLARVSDVRQVSYLDGVGRERRRVSATDPTVDGGIDYSKKPEFLRARSLGRYFGPVSYVRDSQPHMTISVAESGSGRGVVLAVIDLAVVTDVIARARVGSAGYGYAVNSRGELVAHPDTNLRLGRTSFATLPQVQAALEGGVETRGELGDDRARP